MTNHKDLINEAIHNYYHENTELEMELKDYFYEVKNKAQAFDEVLEVMEDLNQNFGNNDSPTNPEIAFVDIENILKNYKGELS
jgi:hypothetical protein